MTSASSVLELFNSLLLCFVASEALLRPPQLEGRKSSSSSSSNSGISTALAFLRRPTALALCINLLLSESAALALASLSHRGADVLHGVRGGATAAALALATPMLRLSEAAGGRNLISLLLTLLIFGVWVGWGAARGGDGGAGGSAGGVRRRGVSALLVPSALSAAVYLLLRFRVSAAHAAVHHSTALKVIAVAAAFALACFLDIRRFARGLTARGFARELACALAYVAPLFPCLAVAISLGFFVLISLLELVGIDPHVINGAVMYGTLYGPFAWVYFVAKRRCLANSDFELPTTTTTTTTIIEGKGQQHDHRSRSRLLK